MHYCKINFYKISAILILLLNKTFSSGNDELMPHKTIGIKRPIHLISQDESLEGEESSYAASILIEQSEAKKYKLEKPINSRLLAFEFIFKKLNYAQKSAVNDIFFEQLKFARNQEQMICQFINNNVETRNETQQLLISDSKYFSQKQNKRLYKYIEDLEKEYIELENNYFFTQQKIKNIYNMYLKTLQSFKILPYHIRQIIQEFMMDEVFYLNDNTTVKDFMQYYKDDTSRTPFITTYYKEVHFQTSSLSKDIKAFLKKQIKINTVFLNIKENPQIPKHYLRYLNKKNIKKFFCSFTDIKNNQTLIDTFRELPNLENFTLRGAWEKIESSTFPQPTKSSLKNICLQIIDNQELDLANLENLETLELYSTRDNVFPKLKIINCPKLSNLTLFVDINDEIMLELNRYLMYQIKELEFRGDDINFFDEINTYEKLETINIDYKDSFDLNDVDLITIQEWMKELMEELDLYQQKASENVQIYVTLDKTFYECAKDLIQFESVEDNEDIVKLKIK